MATQGKVVTPEFNVHLEHLSQQGAGAIPLLENYLMTAARGDGPSQQTPPGQFQQQAAPQVGQGVQQTQPRGWPRSSPRRGTTATTATTSKWTESCTTNTLPQLGRENAQPAMGVPQQGGVGPQTP